MNNFSLEAPLANILEESYISRKKESYVGIRDMELARMNMLVKLLREGLVEIGRIYYQGYQVKRVNYSNNNNGLYTIDFIIGGNQRSILLTDRETLQIEMNVIKRHPDLSYFTGNDTKDMSDEDIAQEIKPEDNESLFY